MKALIVDDHPQCRALTSKLVTHLGFEALAASDQHEAEALLARHRGQISLAILDLDLGDAPGADLARRFDVEQVGTPVLFMSGHGREVCEAMNVLGPRRAFIEKPFSFSRLARAIDALMTGVPHPRGGADVPAP